MPNLINADNGVVSGFAGVRTTADGTGNLALQSNGVTLMTLATNNTVTISGTTSQTGNASFSNVSTTGSIGVGTSSPGAKLDVVGNVLLSGQNTADQFIRIGSGRTGNDDECKKYCICSFWNASS